LGGGRIALVACHDVNFVDLHLALEFHRRHAGDQALAQRRGHDVDIVLIQTQFTGNLKIGKVEAHEVKTQNPDAQRLMMAGQDRATEVIKAAAAALAEVALAVPLSFIVAVSHDRSAVACGAAHTIRPTMLTDQRETLVVIDERGKINQLCGSHESLVQ